MYLALNPSSTYNQYTEDNLYMDYLFQFKNRKLFNLIRLKFNKKNFNHTKPQNVA